MACGTGWLAHARQHTAPMNFITAHHIHTVYNILFRHPKSIALPAAQKLVSSWLQNANVQHQFSLQLAVKPAWETDKAQAPARRSQYTRCAAFPSFFFLLFCSKFHSKSFHVLGPGCGCETELVKGWWKSGKLSKHVALNSVSSFSLCRCLVQASAAWQCYIVPCLQSSPLPLSVHPAFSP